MGAKLKVAAISSPCCTPAEAWGHPLVEAEWTLCCVPLHIHRSKGAKPLSPPAPPQVLALAHRFGILNIKDFPPSFILEKFQIPLPSLPSSINRLLIPVGSIQISDFKWFLNLQMSWGFSRLFSLHTWLKSACRAHSSSLIDYFNLFWDCC